MRYWTIEQEANLAVVRLATRLAVQWSWAVLAIAVLRAVWPFRAVSVVYNVKLTGRETTPTIQGNNSPKPWISEDIL